MLMKRSTRRQLFYALLALFIVAGSAIVFYADGWRLDFAKWRFEKVGGIYVRSFPENAAIYLDGKLVENQSGFFSPGTLISNLLPQTYNLTLKETGYDVWQENVDVLPSFVTQFKYAVLVPRDATPAPSSTAKQLAALLSQAATTTNPYDQNQKIITGKNKLSIFDITQATTTENTTVPGKNIAAKWISGNLIGILQENNELYLYDTNARTLAKLADDVKDFSATKDGSMVAALEYRSLEIFSLSGQSNYYRFNLPDVPGVQSVIWYKDRAHLFVVYPDHVSFLDLADASLMNFTTVTKGSKPFYDPQANALYVIGPSGTLLQFDFSN